MSQLEKDEEKGEKLQGTEGRNLPHPSPRFSKKISSVRWREVLVIR